MDTEALRAALAAWKAAAVVEAKAWRKPEWRAAHAAAIAAWAKVEAAGWEDYKHGKR